MIFLLLYSASVGCFSVFATNLLCPRPFTAKRVLIEFPIAIAIDAITLIVALVLT